jgi:hypothetical protein
MPVFETFASRVAAAAKAGAPDVYVYDELPPFLRKQISQIFTDCIGPGWKPPRLYDDIPPRNANAAWYEIARLMDREIESFSFPDGGGYAFGHCLEYLKTSTDLNGVLSLIEICTLAMSEIGASRDARQRLHDNGANEHPKDGIIELNERFFRAGVGYQFENGQIIRVDSQYVHAEVVKEALRLLSAPEFEKTNTEFMTAHRHLRDGNLRDCNTSALRAMESALKAICDARGWTYQKGDAVERLIAVVRGNGLFPDYLGGYSDNLIGAMKGGVPKIRDRQGGHGAAPDDHPVPDHIAAFALHLAATNIVMLAKAHREMV